MSTIYLLLKRMITTGNYNKEDMENKLNVFFAVNQITEEQYLELLDLITPKKEPEAPKPEENNPQEKEEVKTPEDEKVEDEKIENDGEEGQ